MMERWKDGRMEGWKDGRMEGWKYKTQNNEQKENAKDENKKTRKSVNKKAQPRHTPNVDRTFCSKQNDMQLNDMASASCACKDGKHAYSIFWQPLCAAQITVLSAYLPR